MCFIGAEYNRFLHAIGRFEIGCDLFRNFLDAILDHDIVIKITVGVDPVLNQIAELVHLTFAWTPAFTDVGMDIDDFEGR